MDLDFDFDYTRDESTYAPGRFFESYFAHIRDLGFRDSKGRAVGYQFHLSRFEDANEWHLRPHVLRDGVLFGAIPRGYYVSTAGAGMTKARELLAKRLKEYAKHKDFTRVEK